MKVATLNESTGRQQVSFQQRRLRGRVVSRKSVPDKHGDRNYRLRDAARAEYPIAVHVAFCVSPGLSERWLPCQDKERALVDPLTRGCEQTCIPDRGNAARPDALS